jgi:hypothetical protein
MLCTHHHHHQLIQYFHYSTNEVYLPTGLMVAIRTYFVFRAVMKPLVSLTSWSRISLRSAYTLYIIRSDAPHYAISPSFCSFLSPSSEYSSQQPFFKHHQFMYFRRVPLKEGKLLTRWATISVHKSTLLHGVGYLINFISQLHTLLRV